MLSISSEGYLREKLFEHVWKIDLVFMERIMLEMDLPGKRKRTRERIGEEGRALHSKMHWTKRY